MDNPVETVKVRYEYVGGAHFFYSDDRKALGLTVAHKALRIAFEEVAKVLKIFSWKTTVRI